jgi:hypothetical protein
MDFFYIISKHFWMIYCSYSTPKRHARAQPIIQARTPHGFDHDIRTLPRWPDFHHNSALQQQKMKGDVADDLISRHHCSQPLTKFSVTGLYELPPGVLMNKISTQN